MLRVMETVLPIPGLQRQMTILQITDLHLIETDHRDTVEVRALAARQREWFPHSAGVLESLREYLRATPPDYVIFTGDVLGFPTRRNLETLRAFLERDCPPWLYVFGNHERMFFPEDLNEETRSRYTGDYAFAWRGDPDIQVRNIGGVLLVGVDDSDGQFSESQCRLLYRLIEQEIPCLLFVHIPLYLPTLKADVLRVWGQPLMAGTPLEEMPDMDTALRPTRTTAELVRRLTTQETAVRAIFSGHVHFAHEDVFYGENKQYITPMAATYDSDEGVGRLIRLIPD